MKTNSCILLKSVLQGVFFALGTYLLSIIFSVIETRNIVFDLSIKNIAQHVMGGFLFFLGMIYINKSKDTKK